MRVLTFAKTFPKCHIRAGEPTYFVEKIVRSLHMQGAKPWDIPDAIFSEEMYYICGPKLHTIRAGNRWKAGDMASLRIWSDKPRRTKQIEFAQVEVKRTQIFEIKVKNKQLVWCIDGDDRELFAIGSTGLEVIAHNDGLAIEDFISWFSVHPKSKGMEFSGQILTWDDKIKYL